MISPTCPKTVDSTSLDITKPISSHTRWDLYTTLPSNLFMSDLPPSSHSNLFHRSDSSPSDHKKTDEEPVGEFLGRDVCRCMSIKDFSPK